MDTDRIIDLVEENTMMELKDKTIITSASPFSPNEICEPCGVLFETLELALDLVTVLFLLLLRFAFLLSTALMLTCRENNKFPVCIKFLRFAEDRR